MRYRTGDVSIGHWVAQRTGEEWHDGKGATLGFYNQNDEIVSGFVFYEYNGRTVWLGLAADDSFASPEAFNMVADYVFRQLGCEWCRCKVAATNDVCVRLTESVGFELETVLKDSHPMGDENIYRMHRDRCAWLNLEQAKSDWKKPN